MAAEQTMSADERRSIVERRLDELDRLLLGLVPRSERLAIVANVEARVRELGELPTEVSASALPITATAIGRTGNRARRSRLAFSSGVLGIIVAACLIGSPVLYIALAIFGELLGETFAIILMGMIAVLITFGGGLAVCFGGVSLLRLARRDQTATGTGWAITGLCTGALPMLIGLVGILTLGVQLVPTEAVHVSWNVTTPATGPTIEPVSYPAAPMYGTPPISEDGTLPMPGPVLPDQGWVEAAEPRELKSDSKPGAPLLPSAPATETVENED